MTGRRPARPRSAPLPQLMLTAREAASLAGLSVGQVHYMARVGTFPRSIDLGGSVRRWLAAEVEAWVAQTQLQVPKQGVPRGLVARVRKQLYELRREGPWTPRQLELLAEALAQLDELQRALTAAKKLK